MSIETNKSLVEKHFEAFNARDLEASVAGMAPDMKNHAAIPQAQGREGARAILTKLLSAFPDMRIAVDDIVAEGDRVVCRVTVTGTHEGPLDFAKMPLPATGKRFRTTHIHVFRIASGAIVERWAERDDLGMLQQLGLMPMLVRPAAPKAEVQP